MYAIKIDIFCILILILGTGRGDFSPATAYFIGFIIFWPEEQFVLLASESQQMLLCFLKCSSVLVFPYQITSGFQITINTNNRTNSNKKK